MKQRVAIRTTHYSLTSEESLSYVNIDSKKQAPGYIGLRKQLLSRILKDRVPRALSICCVITRPKAPAVKRNQSPEAADEAITDLVGSKKHNYFRYFRWQTGALAAAMCFCALCCLALFHGLSLFPTVTNANRYREQPSKQKASKLLQHCPNRESSRRRIPNQAGNNNSSDYPQQKIPYPPLIKLLETPSKNTASERAIIHPG